MKCWKCGNTLENQSKTCLHCGANLQRLQPQSIEGKALRKLYDEYGAMDLLSNTTVVINGFNDYCPDEKKFRNQLKLALDAGVGKLYQYQIQSIGYSDISFVQKVENFLSEEAGLSDKAKSKLMKSFDEMIGWPVTESTSSSTLNYANILKEEPIANEVKDFTKDRKNLTSSPQSNKKKPKYFPASLIVIIALLSVGFLIYNNQLSSQPNNTSGYATTEPKIKTTTKVTAKPTASPTLQKITVDLSLNSSKETHDLIIGGVRIAKGDSMTSIINKLSKIGIIVTKTSDIHYNVDLADNQRLSLFSKWDFVDSPYAVTFVSEDGGSKLRIYDLCLYYDETKLDVDDFIERFMSYYNTLKKQYGSPQTGYILSAGKRVNTASTAPEAIVQQALRRTTGDVSYSFAIFEFPYEITLTVTAYNYSTRDWRISIE